MGRRLLSDGTSRRLTQSGGLRLLDGTENGLEATALQGSVTQSIAIALVGAAITLAAGDVSVSSPNRTAALTGSESITAVGSVVQSAALVPAGASVTFSQGAYVLNTVPPALSGSEAISAIGSTVATPQITPTGQATTTGQGTLALSSHGIGALVSQGTPLISGTVALSGSAFTSGQGLVSPNSNGVVPLIGSASTGQQTSPSPGWGQALTGSVATSGIGTLGVLIRPTDITGQSSATGSGTVTAAGNAVTVNITGEEATSALGNVLGGYTFIQGHEDLAEAGTVAPDSSVALTGSESLSATGSIFSTGQDAVDTLLTSSQGSPAIVQTVAITGVSATGAQGTVSITNDASVALSGSESVSGIGSLEFNKQQALTGSVFSGAQYNVGAPGGAALSGAESSVIAGDVFTTNDRTFALSGLSATVQDGLAVTSYLAFATGQELTLSAQDIGPRGVNLTGQVMTLGQGDMAIPRPDVRIVGGGHKLHGKNYIYKGKKYYDLTNEELAALIGADAIDITREDIKVSYKDKKPHIVSKQTWGKVKAELEKLGDIPKPDLTEDEQDIEDILALL